MLEILSLLPRKKESQTGQDEFDMLEENRSYEIDDNRNEMCS